MDPSVVNKIISASLMGVPQGYLSGEGFSGQTTVNKTAPTPKFSNSLAPGFAVTTLNRGLTAIESGLSGLAASHAAAESGQRGGQSGGIAANPTSGGNAPGVGGSAVAGGTPGPADFGPARGAAPNVSTSSLDAPSVALGGGPGNSSESPTGTSEIGPATVAGTPGAGPATPTVANAPTAPTAPGPTAPSPPAPTAPTPTAPTPTAPTAVTTAPPTTPAAVTSGLGAAAPTSAAVNSPAPSTQAPAPPVDMGGLMQLVLSLVLGGNPGPQLSQLAQAASGQLAPPAGGWQGSAIQGQPANVLMLGGP
jgi:hypothetical protein